MFGSFEAVGTFNDVSDFSKGGRWNSMPAAAGGMRRAELPAPNSVIMFASPSSLPLARPGGLMTLNGKTLTLTYETGLIVRGRYSADVVTWEALSGPATGSRGTERTHVYAVSQNRFFVNWIESSGTTVSQILDLDVGQVWSFVTYSVDGTRQGTLDRGTITIEDGHV